MHGDATLSPFATVLGYLIRYGVPFVCAAIVIDAGRRSASSLGRRPRIAWIATSLALLLTLVAGFVFPGVSTLRILAVASLPLALVLVVTYLLTVVFARNSERSAPAGPDGS